MANKCIMTGRVAREPKVTTLENGIKKALIVLAESDNDNHVNYIPVILWRSLAESVEKYVEKGDHILVEGSWRTFDSKKDDGSIETRHTLNARSLEFLETKAAKELRKKVVAPEVKATPERQKPEPKEIKFEEESKSNQNNDDSDWDFNN